LNITDEIDNFYEGKNNLIYYKFPIRDNNLDDISSILNESYNVIEHHLELGDRVLVHCYMGASRSASVVIHYIMKKYGVSYEQTVNLVKRGRPVVNLTEKFQNTLKGSMY
jgi:protein-tyrosine phosphatase